MLRDWSSLELGDWPLDLRLVPTKRLSREQFVDVIHRRDDFTSDQEFLQITAAAELFAVQKGFPEISRDLVRTEFHW